MVGNLGFTTGQTPALADHRYKMALQLRDVRAPAEKKKKTADAPSVFIYDDNMVLCPIPFFGKASWSAPHPRRPYWTTPPGTLSCFIYQRDIQVGKSFAAFYRSRGASAG